MESYSQFEDHELLTLLKRGDELAYAEIYKRYWPVLYRFARRLLQNDHEPGDVIQDVFVTLWAKASTLDIKVSLSSFLYTCVRNSILKIFEKSKVRAKYIESLAIFIEDGVNITDHLLRERELAHRIEQEISRLPTKMREVFELSRKSHLSYHEIAEELNISENTVKKQVNNSLKILRTKLKTIFLPIFLSL